MNRKRSALLIVLLIILQSGCTPANRKVDNIVTEPNAEIQENDSLAENEPNKAADNSQVGLNDQIQELSEGIKENRNQLENVSIGIVKKLEELKFSLNKQIQELAAGIQKNMSQTTNEPLSVSNDLEDLKSSINKQAQQLSEDIQENRNRLENETSSVNKELSDLKSSLNGQIQDLSAGIQESMSQLEYETFAVNRDLDDVKSGLSNQFQGLSAGIQEKIDSQKIYWIIVILVLVIIFAGNLLFIKYKMVQYGDMSGSKITSREERHKNQSKP